VNTTLVVGGGFVFVVVVVLLCCCVVVAVKLVSDKKLLSNIHQLNLQIPFFCSISGIFVAQQKVPFLFLFGQNQT
jgi:hypothetical protein